MTSPILQACDLHRRYADVVAVNGVSLDVTEGSCLGLLGPNGAGKSTTMEMLEGLLPPSAGRILFRGASLGAAYRERIGIQFQTTALQDFLSVRENLRFFQALYRRRRPLAELIDYCNLGDYLDRDARRLSGGQRQRLLLAIALVNDPELVFLDEPTTGLDPQARRNFWDLIERLRAEGKTVILSTHYMDEAYRLCDDIAIMDHGRIIARGSPESLLAQHFDDVVLQLPVADIGDWRGVDPQLTRNGVVELRSADVGRSLAALQAASIPLQRLQIRQRTLEDLFLELTGAALRG